MKVWEEDMKKNIHMLKKLQVVDCHDDIAKDDNDNCHVEDFPRMLEW
jgi:hypothetical protein